MSWITPRTWVNGSGLALNATNLNAVEVNLAALDSATLGGKNTFASRPTAAAGNAGLLYLATDVNGGTLYRSTGSAWDQVAAGVTQAGGQELSHAQLSTDFTLTHAVADTPAIVTGLSQTFTAPGGRLRFVVTLPMIMLTSNAGIWRFKLWDGTVGSGTLLGAIAVMVNTIVMIPLVSMSLPITLSAGSHTINTSYESDTVGVNGAIWGASLFPATVDVFKP